MVEACRKLGIKEQTYYRWKKEYGGLRVDQAKRLKGLEQENVRLKRLVADLSLDNSILKVCNRRGCLEEAKQGMLMLRTRMGRHISFRAVSERTCRTLNTCYSIL